LVRVDSGRIGNPAQAARGDSGDAAGDAVALAEFLRAVFEEADERPVDIAEAEEAKVVGGDGFLAQGLSPSHFTNGDAALKRRSSTSPPRPLFHGCTGSLAARKALFRRDVACNVSAMQRPCCPQET